MQNHPMRIHGICWVGYGVNDSDEVRNLLGNHLDK